MFLTIALTTWLAGEHGGGVPAIALRLLWASVAGLAVGYAGGRVIVAALNKYDLPAGLHSWLALVREGQVLLPEKSAIWR